MKVSYSRDLADPAEQLAEALRSRPCQPLRLRIQPMILRKGQYESWMSVCWTLKCQSVDEGLAFMDAFDTFCKVAAASGPGAVRQFLEEANELEARPVTTGLA